MGSLSDRYFLKKDSAKWSKVTFRFIYYERCTNNSWVNSVTDLFNALPGNISVNTAQNATIDEAVFSMSCVPSSYGTTGLCNPFLSNGSINTLPFKQ
jgi:hypothetical protein